MHDDFGLAAVWLVAFLIGLVTTLLTGHWLQRTNLVTIPIMLLPLVLNIRALRALRSATPLSLRAA